MRLKSLKLAGFKSFVDPSIIHFSEGANAIVGPNGCGKSNIVDAILWVIGETSVKNLRSESQADVIFMGTSSKKPLGQASVELVFDNSDGRIGGAYAGYNAISIKRKVDRSGTSQYFLNGERCRRRDIVSILLGTGLGTNHYAIVQQGMVNRLIESQKEDVRLLIEEASGISKYRERRRQTEQVLNHTHSNLERVNLSKNEIEAQLNGLAKQVAEAQRYRVLQEVLKSMEQERLLFVWNNTSQVRQNRSILLAQQEEKLLEHEKQLHQSNTDLQQQKDKLTALQEALQSKHQQNYMIGAEVSRLEQQSIHNKERLSEIEHELKTARSEHAILLKEDAMEKEKLQSLRETLSQYSPMLENDIHQEKLLVEEVKNIESLLEDWQLERDTLFEQIKKAESCISLCQSQKEQLHKQLASSDVLVSTLNSRILEIRSEIQTVDIGIIEVTHKEQESALQAIVLEKDKEQQIFSEIQKQIDIKKQTLESLRLERSRLAERNSILKEQHARQRVDKNENFEKWLHSTQLKQVGLLVDRLIVDPQWVRITEMLLGDFIGGAIVQQSVLTYADSMHALEHKTTLLYQDILDFPAQQKSELVKQDDLPCLFSDVVVLPRILQEVLHGIYAATNLTEADHLLKANDQVRSVVTVDGFWLGRGWMKFMPVITTESSLLVSKLDLDAVTEKLDYLDQEIATLSRELDAVLQSAGEQEAKKRQLDAAYDQALLRFSGTKETLLVNRQRLVQLNKRLHENQDDLTQQTQKIESIRESMVRIDQDFNEQKNKLDALSKKEKLLLDKRLTHVRNLKEKREDLEQYRYKQRDTKIQHDTLHNEVNNLEKNLQKNIRHLAKLTETIGRLKTEDRELLNKAEATKPLLDEQLSKRLESEKQLKQIRTDSDVCNALIRELESNRNSFEQTFYDARNSIELEKQRIKEHDAALQSIAKQLQLYLSDEIESVIQSITLQHTSEQEYDNVIAKTKDKIEKIGAVNLLAEEEEERLSERRKFLCQQLEDLEHSLATLKSAIKKIDMESRDLFLTTFKQLNENFSRLIPVLFGGGSAQLGLTDEDNILQTGVTINVQPPGKRNRTIQSLSGGEKALSAIALIFSLFRLNPAPFCVLDEIDAPLDDINVSRFTKLLKEMVTDVQFICITHNKITMHDARQLIGVTMHEPGVSRLVSVNLDQAVKLAVS